VLLSSTIFVLTINRENHKTKDTGAILSEADFYVFIFRSAKNNPEYDVK
jgi:hypothetical protein